MGMKKVFPAKENHKHQITITLQDDTGAAILESAITTIKLWLWNAEETPAVGAYINTRNDQDAHDANNCTYGTLDGLWTWDTQVLDNPNRSGDATELHMFEIKVTHTQAGGVFHETYGIRVTKEDLPT